ncbi:MAG: DNA mismatch repair protein MutS [Acetobacter sp.]|nr:DNA mismatch repair protein MutS [Acetobacter sp.]
MNDATAQTLSPTMASIDDMKDKTLTPAMGQYLEIKKEHPDYLLFYRMGDFYELFFEDAVTASGALGLTLTSRSKTKDKEIPMCGVPFHAYEIYMARLIKMGYKVAICEQMEDPKEAKKRGYKAVVRREVVRLVTAGTLTEETLLDAKRNNYIAACYVRSSEIGLAWIDISTGSFFMQHIDIGKVPAHIVLSNALARLNPVELLIDDRLLEYPEYFELFGEYRDQLSVRPHAFYNLNSATNTLLKAYNIKAIDAFGDFSKVELTVAGVLLGYIENTQKGRFPRLEMPTRILGKDLMEIDSATRRSLELLTPTGSGGVSLLKIMDKTVTGIGGRLLAERLAAPTMNIKEINDRLDCVSFFIDNPNVRYEIRDAMSRCLDMERAIQRLSLGRGGPRDLFDLAQTLQLIPRIQTAITLFATHQPDSVYALPPKVLHELAAGFFDHSLLAENITNVLETKREDLPVLARSGGFIRKGAYPPLDYLRDIHEESEKKCQELQKNYSIETGVTGIKIKNNSVIGYFIEVPSKFADKLLENKKFIHRQSVLNAVRFTTEELVDLENEVNTALERALEMEMQIFNELTEHALAQADAIQRSAERIAALDVSAALAELAQEEGYVRPQVDDSLDFNIIEGRHPVVETVMRKEGAGKFVGNNCVLNAENDRIWLLTGPNMAGKSTFLRQNALIAIMAQMGSFVPAKSAKIGVIDKIFSRVGASDDLARGRSTFMVEMVETAAILNRAGERSFVILDEIGRGTATFDGLSIAWAVVEQLAEVNKCRTVFATHYHELTKLHNRLEGLSLHCMKIKEFSGEVVFMHEVIEGAADRSYGIHVAKLAGLPELTIKRAEQVLGLLEEEKQNKILTAVEDDLPLFSVLQESVKEEPKEQPKSAVEEELKEIDIDNLSPREALAKLYELKEKLGE